MPDLITHSMVDLGDGGIIEERPDFDDFVVKDFYLKSLYPTVRPTDFYRYLFPVGSFERQGHPEDRRGNGIAVSIDVEKKQGAKTVVTDGLEQLDDLLEQSFVVMSPIAYYGRSRRADHALWLHALTFDIDYVLLPQLKTIIDWFDRLRELPRPTFVVNSGHGVHLYYVFEQPIPMYPSNQREFMKLKRNLINKIWTKYTSNHPERKEALGVVQGFRMVGSYVKMGFYRLSAWRTGGRVTLDYLNGFAWEGQEAKISLGRSGLSLDEAKMAWPEWYERRIIRREEPGRWHVKRDLYDWFLRRVEAEGKVGHRYFCMMCLAIYAAKCDVAESELRRDAARLQEIFDDMGRPSGEPFTWEETEQALEAYNESYVKYPRETIERITAIPMPANKRNGRKQLLHMATMRAVQDVIDPKGEWRNKNGRPKGSGTKADQIRAYATAHPDASHSRIAKALSVSRTTVIKWLKKRKTEVS